jgi:DNA-binding NtrC family response regulator
MDDGKSGPVTARLADPTDLALEETHLTVTEGFDVGVTVPCGVRPVRIGSAPDCELVLRDPAVSRKHASVQIDSEGLRLTDLGSTNGTFVGALKIKDALVPPGTVFKVGKTAIRVDLKPRARSLPLAPTNRFGKLVGSSPAMRQLFTLLGLVAPSPASILIGGPTGTGKELVARALHEASPRKAGPFVVLDCGAADPGLISAELFGHEAGAFTGATGARAGLFEQAQGGTIFLDEVGELPLDLQPKLLRVLEAREVRRLGGSKTIAVDARVLAATHRDLEQMVRAGRFREDLYYRLAQMRVLLPPLADRREDIPLIVQTLLEQLPAGTRVRTMSPEAIALLAASDFPGNVRQLRNVVEQSVTIATGERVEADDILMLGQLMPRAGVAAPAPAAPRAGLLPAADERAQLEAALEANDWNLARTARSLGVVLNTVKNRMRRHKLSRPGRKPDSADE